MSYLDAALEGVITPIVADLTLAPSRLDTALRAAQVLRAEAEQGEGPCCSSEEAVSVDPAPARTDPCIVPADAGYRGLENQLYRVEVHRPGDASSATFKWSRDNASVATAWLGQPDPGRPEKIEVADLVSRSLEVLGIRFATSRRQVARAHRALARKLRGVWAGKAA